MPTSSLPTSLQVQDVSAYESGQQLQVSEMFKEGDLIDVAGNSIGKGFQGARTLHPLAVSADINERPYSPHTSILIYHAIGNTGCGCCSGCIRLFAT